MRVSTIIAIIITILLTVVLMQNTDQVKFTIFFSEVYLSKLVVMAGCAVVAFILGIMVGRPRKVRHITAPEQYHHTDTTDERPRTTNTLSDEDRDYIN